MLEDIIAASKLRLAQMRLDEAGRAASEGGAGASSTPAAAAAGGHRTSPATSGGVPPALGRSQTLVGGGASSASSSLGERPLAPRRASVGAVQQPAGSKDWRVRSATFSSEERSRARASSKYHAKQTIDR